MLWTKRAIKFWRELSYEASRKSIEMRLDPCNIPHDSGPFYFPFHHVTIFTRDISLVLHVLRVRTCRTNKTRKRGKWSLSLIYTLNTRRTVSLVIVKAYILTIHMKSDIGDYIAYIFV